MLQIIKSVLGKDDSEVRAMHELTEAGVPTTDSPCRSCADPCDEGTSASFLLSHVKPSVTHLLITTIGHEEFEKRVMVDRLTDMRGSVKPYRRQVCL